MCILLTPVLAKAATLTLSGGFNDVVDGVTES